MRPTSQIWECFIVSSNATGSQEAKCRYCDIVYRAPNPTRMRDHISRRCTKCPDDIRERYSSRSTPTVGGTTGTDGVHPGDNASHANRALTPVAAETSWRIVSTIYYEKPWKNFWKNILIESRQTARMENFVDLTYPEHVLS
jgi:hypothetical protein